MIQCEDLKQQLLDLLQKPFYYDEFLKMDIRNCVSIYRHDEDIQEDVNYYESQDWDTNDVNVYAASITYDPEKRIIIVELYNDEFDPYWLLNVYGSERIERISANHYPPEWNEVYHIHLNQP